MDTDDIVSDEARERINSARFRDIAFAVRRRLAAANASLATDDNVDALTAILLDASDRGIRVTPAEMEKALRGQWGRSPDRAEALTNTIFGKASS